MFIEGKNSAVQVEGTGVADESELRGYIFESAVSAMPDEARKAYLESEECKAAVDEGVVGRRSIIRLNKADDLSRRTKLACLQKAKEDNTAEWQQLRKVQAKRKALLAKIATKYQSRVQRDAVKAQRAMLKVTPNAFTAPLKFN